MWNPAQEERAKCETGARDDFSWAATQRRGCDAVGGEAEPAVRTTAISFPLNFLKAFVHAVLRGLRFILKFLWHLGRQNLKTLPSLRANVIPCPGYTGELQNQHVSMRIVPRASASLFPT